MASSINADNGVVSGSAGLKSSADSTGVLALQTNGTTAISIDASQAVSFTNAPTVTGGTANGVAYLNGSKVLTTGSALVFNGSNFALGVSPSTNSANTSIEINKAGNGLSVFSNTDFRMSRNVYDDGAKYARSSETAVTYRLGNGTFEWYNAPTGTAGSAISFTQAMTLDASGNLCVGTTTAQNRLTIVDSNSIHNGTIHLGSTSYYAKIFQDAASDGGVIYNSYAVSGTAHGHKFHINGTERARIDSSGNLLVGKTTTSATTQGGYISSAGQYVVAQPASTGAVFFQNTSGGATVGTITINASTTTYGTSSDYRLKENIVPMVGALSAVSALKPVTYNWKIDGSDGQGFIAHELAEVCPEAVQGKKDAVDDEGNPVYQGIDTSFLVATLTAAIQEQQALITQLQADVAALKGA